MKKRSLFIIFVVLTLLFALCATTVAFAAEAGSAAENSVEFTKNDLIKLIIAYGFFGLSLIVGLPCLKAVNKRRKHGYVESIVKETQTVADKVQGYYDKRESVMSKRETLRYSIKIATVADMALTTYTEKQIQGYYDIYNDLNSVKTKLSELGKYRGKKEYDEEFLSAVNTAKAVAVKAKTLADNEKIISEYNG